MNENILIDALKKISMGTLDDSYPLRCAPRGELMFHAQKTLDEYLMKSASQPAVEADSGRLCDDCSDTGEIATPEGPKPCPHCRKIY